MFRMKIAIAAFLMACALQQSLLSAQQITLVDKGKAKVSVVLPEAALAEVDGKLDEAYRLHRMAADDLVNYLGKVSGAEIKSGSSPVDGLIPIYVAANPKPIKLSVNSKFGDAYLIDITDKAITLDGESPRSTFYAAARLLHQVGVRWYAPGELGEYVPSKQTITVDAGRTESAPDFHTRNVWQEELWSLRNRLRGPALAQGHAFYKWMEGRKYFETNPEYYPIINGKVAKTQVNLSNPDVADLFAKNILAAAKKGPTNWAGGKAFGIGPDDGLLIDERPETLAMDSGRIDPLLQYPSATDRYIKFVNQVAEKIDDELPEHTLGFYIYSNHKLPPATVKPHPMIRPIVAPITFNRFLSIGNPNEATAVYLEHVIREWKSMVPELGVYLYNFNLADTAMPFTRRLTWQINFPKLHEMGVEYCTIESMPNWHTLVPGNYTTAATLWDVEADHDVMLDEFYANYFGPAAEPMRTYNETLEQAYESTEAYAGSHWSIHRILTPEVMNTLEAAISEAEAKAKTASDPRIAQRVSVHRFSMDFAYGWLNARQSLNEFKLAEAAKHSDAFLANYEKANETFPGWYVRYIKSYFSAFHARSFKDAGRVAEEGVIVHKLPDEMTAMIDKDQIGEVCKVYLPEAGTGNWTKLKTYSAAIDEQGLPHFRGTLWYRHEFALPKAHKDAEVLKLWFGGVDDTATVYLNGEKVGRVAAGNFGPGEVDISEAIKREGNNVLVIGVSNYGITELGTGGIMRPALIYAPKAADKPAEGVEGDQGGRKEDQRLF